MAASDDAAFLRSASLTVFLAALVVRLAYVAAIYGSLGEGGLLGADSVSQYIPWTRAMAESATPFSSAASIIYFTPLYFVYLVTHFTLLDSFNPLFPVLTQACLDALTCVFIAHLGRAVQPRLFLAAGLVAAFNPTQIIVAGLIYTDTLCLFFASAGLAASVKWLATPRWTLAVLAGIAFALATMTRGMVLPWLLGFPFLLLAIALFRRQWCRRHAGHLAAGLLAGLLVLSPLLVRNALKHDTLQLATQGGAHFLYWVVPLVDEAATGTSWQEGRTAMREKLRAHRAYQATENEFARASLMTSLAFEELAQRAPAAIARAWGYGIAINLLSPAILLSPPVIDLPRTGFYDTPGDSKLEKIGNFFFANDNRLYSWILAAGTAGAGLVALLWLTGLIGALGDRRTFGPSLYLVAWTGYLLLLYGPVATPKYRLLMEPALVVFTAWGLLTLGCWLYRQRTGQGCGKPTP